LSASQGRGLIRGLYAVTPDNLDTPRLIELTAAALGGGARVVQYRNKSGDSAAMLAQARALKTLCAANGATLIVNDHIDLALAVDADGVHLGKDDGSCAEARERVGPEKIIGISCYDSLDGARAAAAGGADYVAFGSFFPSRVKPGAVRPPLDLLTRAKAELSMPIVAIGGITAANAGRLARAGAHAVAVITALFDAHDVSAAAKQLIASFESCHEPK
jgi:thiamine-phosphate pyrophosphorylase